MAGVEFQHSNYPSRDMYPHSDPYQPHSRTLPKARDPRLTDSGQLEGQWEPWEDIPPPLRGIPEPGGFKTTTSTESVTTYQTVTLYHQAVGLGPVIPPQTQFNAPEGQEHGHFGHAPQHVAPGTARAAFPDPFSHQIPAPEPQAAEHLRLLVDRYLRHPVSQVDMLCIEPGVAGRFKVVMVLDVADFL
ncbi:hypothetical protein BC826DRAFT_1106912 [Russula brevipes]|nr:hypothetical protein BC826DRAFT_1106912 [Russula brevipes]